MARVRRSERRGRRFESAISDKKYEGKVVDIQDNVVTVKLSQKGGYSYSFFNNVTLSKTFFYSSDGKEYSFKVEGCK